MWLEETRTNDDIIKLRESENETYVYDTVAFLRNTKNTKNTNSLQCKCRQCREYKNYDGAKI